MNVQVVVVDVHDDDLLRAWHDAEGAAVRHGRPHASYRSLAALTASVRHPSPYRGSVLLAAVDGVVDAATRGAVLGTAEVAWTLQDNLHLADVEVDVRPEHRRRGIGRLLHDAADAERRARGRGTALCEVVAAVDDVEQAGLRFAEALGYAVVHTEDHLVLRLPADVEHLRRDPGRYRVTTWTGAVPDAEVDDLVRLRSRMDEDVPTGDVDVQPVVHDVERLRTSEERLARSYATITALVRDADGTAAGYSTLYLPHDQDDVLQDDTLVVPEHRGHGLGLHLKLATLDVLASDHPDRRLVHTWTDPANAPMLRTNTRFGYERVEVMHEVQRTDPA